jgi:hypothetical protein
LGSAPPIQRSGRSPEVTFPTEDGVTGSVERWWMKWSAFG